MENLWQEFESTGSIDAYLRFKNSDNQAGEEQENANNNNGLSVT